MAYFLPIVGLILMGAAGDDPVRERMKQSKTPWDFGCDNTQYFNKENRIICRGHVFANRDDMKVRCDNFEAFRDDKGDIKRLVCADNVHIQSKEGTSSSDKAEWLADNQTLILTGKPVVTQKGTVMRGEMIVYDLKNDRITVKRLRATSTSTPEMPKK